MHFIISSNGVNYTSVLPFKAHVQRNGKFHFLLAGRWFWNHRVGAPGWLSDWASAFGPGRDPGVLGLSPTSGSPERACFSLFLSLCLSWIDKKILKRRKKKRNQSINYNTFLWLHSEHGFLCPVVASECWQFSMGHLGI